MKLKQIVLILGVALSVLVFLCLWFYGWRPVPEADARTAEVLETMAETWWQPDAFNKGIPESQWPPELVRLKPKSIRIKPEGIYLEFGSLLVEEWGLFVLPSRSAFCPQQGTEPSYVHFQGRIYKYSIKG